MPTIPSALNPYTQTPTLRDRSPATQPQDGAADASAPASTAADRPRIEISQEGRALSASRSSQTDKSKSNDEIDDSGLPETIKGMLKLIRRVSMKWFALYTFLLGTFLLLDKFVFKIWMI